MVINHQHQFCYFAIPRTGSKATTKLLVSEYGSKEILGLHASWDDFQNIASEEEKKYLSFCAVRNPLDSIVSRYFKIKTDHTGRFSRGTFLKTGKPVPDAALERYRYITENNLSFAEYFRRYHNEVIRMARHEETIQNVSYIMRYEHLQQDLNKVLQILGLKPKPLPLHNVTAIRDSNFLQYYTPDIIPQVKKVATPLMHKLGYAFPESWANFSAL